MKALFLPALVALVALLPVSGNAAEAFSIKIIGSKSGNIQGSGPNGAILGIASSHEIVSPRDAASGLPTGKRQHKPFVITKEIDKSTPLIAKALVTNEALTTVEFKFFRQSSAGQLEGYYTVTLTNAHIAGLRQWKPSVKDPALATTNFAEYEEILFTYQKITWTYVDGGITAEDDWETPVAG